MIRSFIIGLVIALIGLGLSVIAVTFLPFLASSRLQPIPVNDENALASYARQR